MLSSKAIVLKAFGGYDEMQIKQIQVEEPSAGEVLVQMKACGMNFSDTYNRQGIFTFQGIKPPFVMGAEGAGIIIQVGENVTEFKVGDRIMCWNFRYGMWSELVKLPVNHCCLMPVNMSFQEGACIPVNYVTAYLAILDFGGLRAGQSVLVQSAGGGVGWAASQISQSVENVTVFGTASTSKHEQIKENGVHHAIDYRSSDFVDEVISLSPSGVNIVLDCLSGYDFVRSQKLLKPMGRLIHIGISNMITGERWNLFRILKVWWQTKDISLFSLILGNRSVCGLNIANLQEQDPEAFIYAVKEVLKLYERKIVRPRIDSVWTFDQIADASDHMVKRKNIGKIIILPGSSES